MADIEHAALTGDYLHGAFPYGLLSARPAVPTNTYNPYYYATDNKKLYLYNGSAWAESYVDVDATNFTPTGISSLTNLLCPKVSCSTASATAAKTAASPGFILRTGARVNVTFTNANTATEPTLNIENTGAKAIYNEAGVAVSATSPAYFPAGATVEFWYDGTNWVYVNRVIDEYVNGTSGYEILANGKIRQWGRVVKGSNVTAGTNWLGTITFNISLKDINYNINWSTIFGSPSGGGELAFYDPSTTSIKLAFYNRNSSTVITNPILLWSVEGY